MWKKILTVSVLGLGAGLFQGETAQAGTANTPLAVSATVVDSCHIATGSVNFGTYDVLATSDLDGAGSVTVTCTNGLAWTVLLGQGTTPGGGSSDAAPVRQMASGANVLGYALFTDTGRTATWNNTTGVTGVGDGTGQVTPVYGRIPKSQPVANGSYTDSVVATVNY